jgi:hypothetical protein
MDKHPKAFISYSHSDKEIAAKLSEELRSNGIEVWIDKWEILPGDSLIQKIFEEGLSGIDAFIVIISKDSVNSKWVKQELDVALIKRIEGITKIVPVLIDKTEIPDSLKPLKWIDLSGDFDKAIRDLLMGIFRVYEKPPVGEPPEFIKNKIKSIGGLSSLGTTMGLFLSKTGKSEIGSEEWFSARELKEKFGFSVQETDDAIDELESLGLLNVRNYLGTHPFSHGDVAPTYALFLHFRGHGLDYDPEEDIKSVASSIAAKEKICGEEIVKLTGLPPLRINRAIGYLKDYNIIQTIETLGSAPFDFSELLAKGETRRFVAENCT